MVISKGAAQNASYVVVAKFAQSRARTVPASKSAADALSGPRFRLTRLSRSINSGELPGT